MGISLIFRAGAQPKFSFYCAHQLKGLLLYYQWGCQVSTASAIGE